MKLRNLPSQRNQGVIYYLDKQENISKVVLSGQQIKRALPNHQLTLFSSIPVSQKLSDKFDAVVIFEGAQHFQVGKIRALLSSPYENTLYLDTNTFPGQSLAGIFDALKHYDIQLVANATEKCIENNVNISPCYKIFNSDVIIFKKCRKTNRLLASWLRMCDEIIDQSKSLSDYDMLLTELIYNSSIRILTLSDRYNLMKRSNFIRSDVKIFNLNYFPGINARELNLTLNSSWFHRVYCYREQRVFCEIEDMVAGNFENAKKLFQQKGG